MKLLEELLEKLLELPLRKLAEELQEVLRRNSYGNMRRKFQKIYEIRI